MTIGVQVALFARIRCRRGVPFQRAAGCPATVTVHPVPSLVLNLVKCILQVTEFIRPHLMVLPVRGVTNCPAALLWNRLSAVAVH